MTQEKDMEKEYDKLRAKHNLPELKELDKEFCIGKLEETDLLLRTIINKMNERIEHTLKILGEIIQPETNVAEMYESEAFSDEEKKEMFELFKKISVYHTDLLLKDFEYEEASAAQLINKVYADWNAIKQEFIKILEKIKDSWKNETKSKLELGYFG